jgi:superfamily II DNA or RNA helicase
MKAVISNKIYLEASPELMNTIMDKLTYRVPIRTGKGGNAMGVETIRNYSIPKAGIISIPQGRLDLVPDDYDIIDKRTVVEVDFPEPKLPLNLEQKPIWDLVEGSCFLNAKPGWGKTFTALHIAMKLGQKTLVVCHNTMLRDQWVKEVEVMFGIKAGIIGSGNFNIEPIIVIANVQTLTKHTTDLANTFGTLIMDEAHHCPATTFTSIVNSSKAKYRVALSGTMERKDGKHILFKDFFGPVVYKPSVSNVMLPTIKILKSTRKLLPGAEWVKKINDLMYDEEYIEFIALLAARQAMKGHKVLIVADRTEFLTRVNEILGDNSLLIIGASDYDEREEAKKLIETPEKDIICASRSIFSEGISINCLSCLILATPYSSTILLEQLIGRIQRMYPGKLPPIAIDIQFQGEYNQNNTRTGLYLALGWEVEYV